MRRAVFFDRDGVINELFYNPETNEFESPMDAKDLKLKTGALESLKKIQDLDFLLFLISNQPSFAKGKTSLENIQQVHEKLHGALVDFGIHFSEYYYCFHHPKGIVEGYSYDCACRKPGPFFLFKAADQYRLDMNNSWLVGDQDIDILCGQKAGVKTILIEEKHSASKRGSSCPDYVVKDIQEAVSFINTKMNSKT
ncbi:MAG: HAD-IIIA family hydrolase [Candidatus Omnitrophica bacterium]|nr:HAD-IIIA family hydrolase [Candidatus Omnitrophota bacterium]